MSTTTIQAPFSGTLGYISFPIGYDATSSSNFGVANSANTIVTSSNVSISSTVVNDGIGGVVNDGIGGVVLPARVNRAKITIPSYNLDLSNSTMDFTLLSHSGFDIVTNGTTTNEVNLTLDVLDDNNYNHANFNLFGVLRSGVITATRDSSNNRTVTLERKANIEGNANESFTNTESYSINITPTGDTLAERTLRFQVRMTTVSSGHHRGSIQGDVL